MKVSWKTEYALRTVLDISLHGREGLVRAADISERQKIPRKFLEQILLSLRNGGIVVSRRGARGGYLLASPPSQITIASVVSLTEGILAEGGRASTRSARQTEESLFDPVWEEVGNGIRRTLSGITFQDMCDKARAKSSGLNYTI